MTPPKKRKAQNLYRIVSFDRAVQLLTNNELYFSHPSTWLDPYDQGFAAPQSADLRALCWCRKAVSDAMWRIYSPNGLGVRIGTTRERLQVALENAKWEQGVHFKIQNVEYLGQQALDATIGSLREALKSKNTFGNAAALLFYKRMAFDHELETRVVVRVQSTQSVPTREGVTVKVNARELVRSVWIDPRASQEYVDAFTFFLKEKLKFPGTVKKSALYTARDPQGV